MLSVGAEVPLCSGFCICLLHIHSSQADYINSVFFLLMLCHLGALPTPGEMALPGLAGLRDSRGLGQQCELLLLQLTHLRQSFPALKQPRPRPGTQIPPSAPNAHQDSSNWPLLSFQPVEAPVKSLAQAFPSQLSAS